jgi:hypothetical protein
MPGAGSVRGFSSGHGDGHGAERRAWLACIWGGSAAACGGARGQLRPGRCVRPAVGGAARGGCRRAAAARRGRRLPTGVRARTVTVEFVTADKARCGECDGRAARRGGCVGCTQGDEACRRHRGAGQELAAPRCTRLAAGAVGAGVCVCHAPRARIVCTQCASMAP